MRKLDLNCDCGILNLLQWETSSNDSHVFWLHITKTINQVAIINHYF